MEKTVYIHVRMDPERKSPAEELFRRPGMSVTEAIPAAGYPSAEEMMDNISAEDPADAGTCCSQSVRTAEYSSRTGQMNRTTEYSSRTEYNNGMEQCRGGIRCCIGWQQSPF